MSVNILDQNGNLKKIAHGFSESKFNTFRSDVISNIEMTDTASKDYAVGDFLIMANGQLAQVTSVIYQDMTINLSNVRITTVEEMIAAKADSADIPDVSKYQKIFTGTMAEWNQLTTEQKTAYDLANITDDLGTEADIVDAVSDGDMRAVTSNAVHDALESKISTSETTGLVKNDGSIDTKSYAEKVANGTENNLAGLDENGNLKDGGWSSVKTTTAASGNPISITGLKSNQLAINPVITFDPVQAGSGTPSPVNERPISGYDKVEVESCGKNIFDEIYTNGYWDATTGEYVSSNNWRASKKINVKPNTKYTFSGSNDSTGGYTGYLVFWDKNDTYIGYIDNASATVITLANAAFMAFYTSPAYLVKQIEEGSTATTYEAPNKTTSISESLGQTVYGGSLDVRTGKLTDIPKLGDLGDFTWLRWGSGIFYTDINDKINASATISSLICASCFNYVGSFTGSLPEMNNGDMLDCYTSGYEKRIFVRDIRYDDATAFKTAMTGQKLVYKLATPFTIQLTPHELSLLKNYAYVSTNGTNIAFDYHNGELASLAVVSQLGETVNELGSNLNAYITKNSFGQLVDIKSYTASNMFTFPTDGYLYIRCNASGSKIFVIVTGSNANVGVYIELEYVTQAASTSLYVKKGMKAYVNSGTGNYSCAFVRLV